MSMKRTNGRLGVKAGGLGLMLAAVVSLGCPAVEPRRRPRWSLQDRPSGADQAVVARLHRLNQDELAKARMGVERASRPEVRDYAAMLVREHEEADRKLIAYAELTNMDMGAVAPGGDRRPVGALTLADLSFSSAAAFDHNFSTEMVASHQAAIDAAQTGQGLARAPGVARADRADAADVDARTWRSRGTWRRTCPSRRRRGFSRPAASPTRAGRQTGVEERAGRGSHHGAGAALAPVP